MKKYYINGCTQKRYNRVELRFKKLNFLKKNLTKNYAKVCINGVADDRYNNIKITKSFSLQKIFFTKNYPEDRINSGTQKR